MSEVALGDPTLIGGQDALPGDFPEVIYISSGRSRCSATIVSPKNVILTAAHCIADGGEIFPVEFVVNQQVFSAVCTHHPDYAEKYSNDFAFCKTNQDLNIKPATIINKPVKVGEQATLMGYGITNPRKPDGSGGSGGSGKLRYGLAKITRVDNGQNGSGGGQYFYTLGTVALGFGDSGGPVMLKIDDPKTDKHLISGVNSRGNIVDKSLLSATFMDSFQNWAKAYAVANDVQICGINTDCMSGKPKPDPRPDDDECIEERYNVWRYGKLLDLWQNKLDECQMMKDIILL